MMLVSTARADITPTTLMPMGGYGTATPRLPVGTYKPLQARCVVLWDPTPRVLVSVEVLGLPRSLTQAVRLGLGLPAGDLAIVATHTHNGPALSDPDPYILSGVTDTTDIAGYEAWLTAALVDLVDEALASLQVPVTLDYTTTTQPWSSNRAGLSYVESVVPVLVARRTTGPLAGLPAAVIYGYSAHPVTAGIQGLWDGDYPSAASAVIEGVLPGCVAAFIPGAMGDQDPPALRSWHQRDTLGSQLGQKVLTTLATPGRSLTAVSTAYAEVSLPLDITDTPANMATVRSLFVARESSPTAWYARHAQVMVGEIDAGTYATSITLPVQCWRFTGSPLLKLVLAGGEVVSGYAVYFRGQNGGVNGLWFGGYANEVPCYVPSNELLPPIRTSASYEGGFDTDYPGIAGGSMTIYGQLAHFKAGSAGVETAFIGAVNSVLA